MSRKTLGTVLCGAILGYLLCFFTQRAPKTEDSTEAQVVNSTSPDYAAGAKPKEAGIERQRAAGIREIKPNQVKVSDLTGTNVLARLRALRNTPARPKFDLFDAGGLLSNQAITTFNLTVEQSLEVQKLVSVLYKQTHDLTLAGLQEDPVLTDEAKGIRVMKISPFESELAPGFDQFSDDLVKLFGKEKAGELLAAIPVDRYFGAFGKYDVLIKLAPEVPSAASSPEDNSPYLNVELRDAETGVPHNSMKGAAEGLNQWFPGIFNEEFQIVR